MKKIKAFGKICIGTFPSFCFALLFIAIFFACTFKMRYGYDNFGVIFLPLSIAFALCFYISPTLANLSCNVTSISNIFFEGKFYEIIKWGDNDYSFSAKGSMALGFAVICFLKNIVVCPIIIILSLIKTVYMLFNNDYCDKLLSDSSLTAKSLIKAHNIILVAALLIAIPTWLIACVSYNNHLYENNCIVTFQNAEIKVDSIDTVFGGSAEIIFLNIDFTTTVKTQDLEKIVGDLSITDGEYTIEVEMIKLVSGTNTIQVRSNTGYESPTNENNQHFKNFNVDKIEIRLLLHSIVYKNTSLDYKYGNYRIYNLQYNE